MSKPSGSENLRDMQMLVSSGCICIVDCVDMDIGYGQGPSDLGSD